MSVIKDLQVDADNTFADGTFESISLFTGQMKISICVDAGATAEYAEKCIVHYNKLHNNASLMQNLQEQLAEFFLYMYEEWKDFDLYDDIIAKCEEIKQEYEAGKDLISYLTNPTMYIFPCEGDTEEIGYSIECDCPWEPEHQCSIIIREDKLLYVGPSEGQTAWDDEGSYYCIWKDED